jgi:chromosome segregation ATPase
MAASSVQLSMIDVPPPLPLPPLSTPSLASLFPEDPSLTESSFALSSVSRLNGPVEHPGHNLMNPSVGHRAPSRHGEERRRGGAGSSFTRRVRTAQSEPDLRGGGGGSGLGGSGLGGSGLGGSGLNDLSRPSTSGSTFRTVQPQAMPRSFQVTESTPLFGVEAEHTQYRVEYDALQKAWHKVLFPSLSPSSEKDVMMLEEWMDEQLRPFADQGGASEMGMKDVGFCLQVYNVGLNEIYRQTAMGSRRRARVLDGIWRGYVELLEHTRAADGGAVRQEMEMMKKEMAANVRQTQLAMDRAAAESKRYDELQERFDAMVAQLEGASIDGSASRTKLMIESHKNQRQRRIISKETRDREQAQRMSEAADRVKLKKEAEVEEWRGKYFTRDQEAFEAETKIAQLEDALEEAGIQRKMLEDTIEEQRETVDTAEARMGVLTTLRDEASSEITRLSENLTDTRERLDTTTKQLTNTSRDLANAQEENAALSARVQALSIAETENTEEIRTLRENLEREHERAEMFRQTLEEKEGQLLGEIEKLHAEIDDLHGANKSMEAECKRLNVALLAEKERATVKMSGWMEQNFDMQEIDRAEPDPEDDTAEYDDDSRVAIVARPQELVDEMEKLLAAAVAEKVRLQRAVDDEKERTRLKVIQMQQEAAERETRAQAMFASQRKQLDEARAKEREMHAQLVSMLEEKESVKREGASKSKALDAKMSSVKQNDSEIARLEGELKALRDQASADERGQGRAVKELQRTLEAEERKSTALESEVRELESRGTKALVAAEAALDRANAKVQTLEAKLGHLEAKLAE